MLAAQRSGQGRFSTRQVVAYIQGFTQVDQARTPRLRCRSGIRLGGHSCVSLPPVSSLVLPSMSLSSPLSLRTSPLNSPVGHTSWTSSFDDLWVYMFLLMAFGACG